MTNVASPEEFHQIVTEISTNQEVLADQVEAALGLCYIIERVPCLGRLVVGDLNKFRRDLERALVTVKGVIPNAIRATRRHGGKRWHTDAHLHEACDLAYD